MSILGMLALASFTLCVGFTVWSASKGEDNGGQSIRDSMIEAWQNIVIGFSINYVANLFIIPLVAQGMTPLENFQMGWLYTVISILRSFLIRRYNNWKLVTGETFWTWLLSKFKGELYVMGKRK